MSEDVINLLRIKWNVKAGMIQEFLDQGDPPFFFFWNSSILHRGFYHARSQLANALQATESYPMDIPSKMGSEVILSQVGQETDNLLGACQAAIEVADKSGAQHHLGVQGVGDNFNEILVSGVRKLKRNSNSYVPRMVEPLKFGTEQIKQIAPIEAAAVDVVQLNEECRTAKMQILIQRMNLANEFCPLHAYIHLHTVIILNDVA